MNLSNRKALYFFFGAGSFLVAFPAFLGLFSGVIAFLSGEFESLDIIIATIAGFIGLYSGVVTWIRLPIANFRQQLTLNIGLIIGCISMVVTLTYLWAWPPVFLSGDIWSVMFGSYIYVLPLLIGIALIIEVWLTS